MAKKIDFNETHGAFKILIGGTALALLSAHGRDGVCSCGAKSTCSRMTIYERGFDFWMLCPSCGAETEYILTGDGLVFENGLITNVVKEDGII